MNHLFGASRPGPYCQQQVGYSQQKSIQVQQPAVGLNDQSKRVENRVKGLDDTIKGLENEIKELYVKSKCSRGSTQKMYQQKCLNLMKKKKMYEQQMAGLLTQQYTLDQISFTNDNIQNTVEMGAVMKQACSQQKQMFGQLNPDELEDLKDDMQEMMHETDYVNEMLNRNYGIEVDEAELDQEFANLDSDIFKEQLVKQQYQQQQRQQQQQIPSYPNLVTSNQYQPQQL